MGLFFSNTERTWVWGHSAWHSAARFVGNKTPLAAVGWWLQKQRKADPAPAVGQQRKHGEHTARAGQRRNPGRSDSLTQLRNTNCLSVCVHALKKNHVNFLDNCAQRHCSPWADGTILTTSLSAAAPGSLALTLPGLSVCLQPSILHCWHARLICHLLKKCFVNKIQTVRLAHLGT